MNISKKNNSFVIGIPKEIKFGESRVSLTPSNAAKIIAMGFTVFLEDGAGEKSGFSNQDYLMVGVEIIPQAKDIWQKCDLVMKIHPPLWNEKHSYHEVDWLKDKAHLISFIWPNENAELLEKLQKKNATVIALDQIPRLSRAQKMDVLSSMANIAGYRAVIEAAAQLQRPFAGQITAAGKIPPARLLVIGAGVAGLAAIGVARQMGAIVHAFDTRKEVREQVQSMGAQFLEFSSEEDGVGNGGYAKSMSPEFLAAEKKIFTEQAQEVDVIITTALIPGKKAPILLDEKVIGQMKKGSVIVDMAAEFGGNCIFTQADQIIQKNGVTVIGYTQLASRFANTASLLFSNNLVHLLEEMTLDSSDQSLRYYRVDKNNEVIRQALIMENGNLKWPPPSLSPPYLPAPSLVNLTQTSLSSSPRNSQDSFSVMKRKKDFRSIDLCILGVALGLWVAGQYAPSLFLHHLSVFILAIVIGWQLVWNVTPSLHTPLMSVTNAISGIIVIGAIMQLKTDSSAWIQFFSLIAIFVSSINIVGGFLVTHRILKMFQK